MDCRIFALFLFFFYCIYLLSLFLLLFLSSFFCFVLLFPAKISFQNFVQFFYKQTLNHEILIEKKKKRRKWFFSKTPQKKHLGKKLKKKKEETKLICSFGLFSITVSVGFSTGLLPILNDWKNWRKRRWKKKKWKSTKSFDS